MMDIAKFEMCRNFTILNQALVFLIKWHKTAEQSVPKIDNLVVNVFSVNYLRFNFLVNY